MSIPKGPWRISDEKRHVLDGDSEKIFYVDDILLPTHESRLACAEYIVNSVRHYTNTRRKEQEIEKV